MALRAIVFDCDGVILESVDAKTRAFAGIGLTFGQEAADRLVQYHRRHPALGRFEKFSWFFKTVLNRDMSDKEYALLNDAFARLCLESACGMMLVPGIRGVLEAWSGRVPMYVASGAPEGELRKILAGRGLARYFAGIFGAPSRKTDILRNILAATDATACDCLMVGDSGSDQYAAEAVGMSFYGRGEYFKYSDWPWGHDLLSLNSYLENMCAGSAQDEPFCTG